MNMVVKTTQEVPAVAGEGWVVHVPRDSGAAQVMSEALLGLSAGRDDSATWMLLEGPGVLGVGSGVPCEVQEALRALLELAGEAFDESWDSLATLRPLLEVGPRGISWWGTFPLRIGSVELV